jgi:oxepin-CoA hydrolase/3-oxo-5,6-dehydrosuberyl-CoA semialdehyde dehydrogenase
MKTLASYLCGTWRTGAAPMATLVNPSTEEAIAECSTHGIDLKAALAFGRDVGGPALRTMTFAERGALLKRMSAALHEAREELIELSIDNVGATRGDAKFDIDGGIGTLAFYAKLGETLGDRKVVVEGAGETLLRSPRFAGYHVRVPRTGVAVHINAFNFPVWGFAEKAACALLAGVPVITKPATSTALPAWRAIEIVIDKAQLPKGALQLVCGSVGDLLEGLLPEDVLAFTGSADTGATLRSSRAVLERSVRINVEADSLNAAVLGPDVDPGSEAWHLFIRHTALEMTQKTGQKCTATRRIFVPRARADEVQGALIEKLAAIRVGNPRSDGIDMGPLTTKRQHDDAKRGLQLLKNDGANVVFGGTIPEGKGFFLTPTLLRHDSPVSAKAVHCHEVFGPVSTLMPYEDAGEAAKLVARGEGSLVAGIYSDDKAFLEEMIVACAPWSGRLVIGSTKVADTACTPGMVLPSCVHGGPGRAGGGEELGGERGLHFYMQRTAIQGDRGLLDRILGAPKTGDAAS